MDPSTPNQPATQTPPALPPVGQPTYPVQQVPPPQPKSKVRLFIILGVIIVVVAVAAFFGATYFVMKAEEAAGLKKAQDFITLLEASDRDAAINELANMVGVDANATSGNTDSSKVQELTSATTQAAQISLLLQTTDARLDDSSFGANEAGNKQVTAHYSISTDSGKTGYYTITTVKAGDTWKLAAVEWTTEKPTNK